MSTIDIAVAQIHSQAGKVPANLDRMLVQIRSAAAAGAHAILFAETCIQAYVFTPANLALAEPLDGASCNRLAEWAALYNIVILAGLIERDGDRLHNSHVACFPDGRRAVQRKHIVTPGELAAGLTAGPAQRHLLTINNIRCALVICADASSAAIATDCRAQQVQLRLCPTAGGGPRSEIMTVSELGSSAGLARYAAERSKVFQPLAVVPSDPQWPSAWASANALGHDGVTEMGWHRGHCMIVDRHGLIRAQLPGTCVLEHQLDLMAHARLEFPGE